MKQTSTLILLLVLLLSWLTGCTDVKYPAGRDTKESYGDGTYQLLKSADGTLSLSNEEYHTVIVSHVMLIATQDSKLYAFGEQKWGGVTYEAYTVVDLKTNQLQFYAVKEQQETYFYQADAMREDGAAVFYQSFSEFAEEDANILKELIAGSDLSRKILTNSG